MRRPFVAVAMFAIMGLTVGGMAAFFWTTIAHAKLAANPDFMLGLSGGIGIGLLLTWGVVMLAVALLLFIRTLKSRAGAYRVRRER